MKRGATLKVVLGRRFVVRPSSEKETCQLVDLRCMWLKSSLCLGYGSVGGGDVHLFAAEDESLLDWRDALFLLDALLYPGDLFCIRACQSSGSRVEGEGGCSSSGVDHEAVSREILVGGGAV